MNSGLTLLLVSDAPRAIHAALVVNPIPLKVPCAPK